MNHAAGMTTIEGLEGRADPRAAASALGHHRQTIEGARGILFLHRVGDMGELRVEEEGLSLSEFVQHAVDKPKKDAGIQAHRAGRVEQDDEPEWLFLASALHKVERHAAMTNVVAGRAAQIEPIAAAAREVATV